VVEYSVDLLVAEQVDERGVAVLVVVSLPCGQHLVELRLGQLRFEDGFDVVRVVSWHRHV